MLIEWRKETRDFTVVPEGADLIFLEPDQRGPWTFKTFETASRFAEAVEAKMRETVA